MKPLNPDRLAPPFAQYSHGFSIDAAARRVIVTSGQLGMAKDGTIPEAAEAQAQICFANIEAILAADGAGPGDVVKLTAYVTDRAHMQGYMAARDAWLSGLEVPPASTLVIVSGFTLPEFKVEVEAMAAVPAAL